ncbi:hypothetical protein A676_03178 [Salmonella enterica subsp. enterica serovar Enteritidis str. 2010K-0262]|uniref:Uncharacterized protein n=3 Tax=Salmonella enterica I TaxID=59201 RepID=A0A0F6B693_SALT1|nr:hypothetical protein SPAB_03743 [Salmonella enterica subsp. enterica serovar Paratyphi B str. SPB7]ACY90040.1 hypothetical protein STM14_3631 [Salmonella enterica subsp. enterica serovar Typhimurium str. 14028S]EPI73420.1 hypothetical protein A673_01465 [Salmonella enterica subsp. enterica serovar Enteritidis str. 2009K0958]EPI77459.1 hypothetical protein A672_00419 [Salmonella enterica subsp. enterica serovar Enteritidis str. 08-1080]EPI81101.1 hypothetical protein A676_03178 [Salmonella en
MACDRGQRSASLQAASRNGAWRPRPVTITPRSLQFYFPFCLPSAIFIVLCREFLTS